MFKGLKVRIFPTPEQEILIKKHIGCCRYLYNYMLEYNNTQYETFGISTSQYDMIRQVTVVKRDGQHDWLSEVSIVSLQRTCTDLANAYKRFFHKISNKPKFKSKRTAKETFPIDSANLYFMPDFVRIAKLGKVKYQTNLFIPTGKGNHFTNGRISKQGKKWILSISLECENQAYQLTDKPMGIDLGVKELAVVALGDSKFVFHNINKSPRVLALEAKLKFLQRSLNRKYEVGKKRHPEDPWQKSRNIVKCEDRIRKMYRKLTNIRLNYTHQVTHALVSMLPCVIGMETIDVLGLLKNKHLAESIQKQSFHEFGRQMQYKCANRGIVLIKADRFYPSSKTCSNCGHIKQDLMLSDRTYECKECGLRMDRDYNAARNLAKYATLHLSVTH